MKKSIIVIFSLLIIFTAVLVIINFKNNSETVKSNSDYQNQKLKNDENTSTTGSNHLPEKIIYDVPFTAQAPFGDWDDVRQDYGCEEASILMAMYWVYEKELTPEKALEVITAIAEFEEKKYGHFHDTSTQDTLKILKDYFNYDNAFVKFDIGIEDIKKELAEGNLVIVPIDGTKVDNPYYTPPGPYVHKIVIRGYDDSTQEFITNDPGTLRGEAYRYDYNVLKNALMDYKTGLHEPIEEIRTAMLVIKK